jgi:hypothetical protein
MELKEQKLSEIRNQLDVIIEEIETQSMKGFKLHEVERHLFSRLLNLGLQLLGYYIYLVARLVSEQGAPVDEQGKKLRNKGMRVRRYFSVFGRLSIERTKYYCCRQKTHYELDAALGLPSGRYSYLLEDWMAYGAVEVDFEQSVAYIERILGHQLHGMQSSRCTYHLSGEVESFYEQKDDPYDEESTHLSVGFDGKGVPIIRSQTERAQESAATRLSKGQKRDVKREATVSVSSCFRARARSVGQIIEGLFGRPPGSAFPEQDSQEEHHRVAGRWHEQKHIRAFLSDKQKAIRYGIDDLLKRDKTASKPIIVLMDGDRALEKAVRKVVEEKKITHRVDAYILDFIHLVEYVWKVANARWGEKHPGREDWVKAQAILLLNSKWKEVLAQWQEILDCHPLSTHQAYNVQRAITYVSNRPHMLDYKSYLDKGYPITTGAVESACGHFVKSRMERNAMHWGKQGAQEMLNIRAIKKNGDWHGYTNYFIDKEQQAIYNKAA